MMNHSELRSAILQHLQYSLGREPRCARIYDMRMALSLAIRDKLIRPWLNAQNAVHEARGKRVYYLSMEFLIGRLLEDAIVNLGLWDAAREAVAELGHDFRVVLADEPDAALGNGGLGRLAACFLDSMSTIGCPGYGYGIRYEHGLFRQRFEQGAQLEEPEEWLRQKHAWEFERPEASYRIGFGGEVIERGDHVLWSPADAVMAEAYDTPIIGWKGRWANTLRLWSAQPVGSIDLEAFNRGDYVGAAAQEFFSRRISRVLYPDDTTDQGKDLRLRQEYFFTAASLRDILRRFCDEHENMDLLPQRVAIQLNDTHPAIAGPELVRLLHDERRLDFDHAVELAQSALAYTNHTLMPEALERWSEDLMHRVLPRHLQIISRIDEDHARRHPGRRTRILGDGEVRMGELSFIMAHRVNGVSALHTDLVRSTVFAELNRLHPDRIVNQTNGVTPRRWLLAANPRLSRLITDTIGDGWAVDLERLLELENHLGDNGFKDAFARVKHENKVALSNWMHRERDVSIDPEAMYDVQIKRIHEYKRQHLNILETIALWAAMRANPNGDWVPRVKIFGGKAAPGYMLAKQIIRLINDVGRVINSDPVTRSLLQVVFPPNYNVSMAERLIPGADLSEQISTAGKEASGTGNMKFALNGALTIGTLDGANVEIRELVGEENFFLFGMRANEVEEFRRHHGHAARAIAANPGLADALDRIAAGEFSDGDGERYAALVGNLRDHDHFVVCADFADYWDTQRRIDAAYLDRDSWMGMAALNTARTGWFSSDRTIRGYMADIWDISAMV